MKVVCVDNSQYNNLQVGEVYEGKSIFAYTWDPAVSSIMEDMIWSKNFLYLEGHPMNSWYDCRCFVTLETWRQNQISKLI